MFLTTGMLHMRGCYLSHEHCEVSKFLCLLAWLELEELKQC